MADWPAVPTGNAKAPTPPLDLSLRGSWAMTRRNADVYWKTWKTNFLPPLLEPLLYLVSFGWGIGQLVNTIDVGGGVTMSYRQFIAGAILSITVMQAAFFETTYNSFVRMWFQKTWEAVTATPLSLDDVLVGEILWSASKSVINATLMSLVIAAFGLLPLQMIPLIALLAFLGGLVFGGLGLAVSARVKGIDGFSFAIYLFVTPMMLFSGTFFPLRQLPGYGQAVAEFLPLTHTVRVLRPLTVGSLALPWESLAYLAVGAIVAPALAVYLMKRKLAN